METVRDLAQIEASVLIEGEGGTGKEFVAREIHRLSSRRSEPFTVVPRGVVDATTLRNQLFGHARGALPEATEDRPGLFELGNNGTVFFEEIHDIPSRLQVQIARTLGSQEVTRLGESTSRTVNIRLICATCFDLIREAGEGHFHLDLFYKIRVAHIRLLPLRERRVDIPLLARFYLERCCLLTNTPAYNVHDDAMRILLDYSWPGNMAELQSAIEFATLKCKHRAITVEDLPPEILTTKREIGPRSTGATQSQKDRFLAAINAAGGNRTLAARFLGISRATLYRRLKELGIGGRV